MSHILQQNLAAVLEKEETVGFVNGKDDVMLVPTISSSTSSILKGLFMVLDFLFRDNCRYVSNKNINVNLCYLKIPYCTDLYWLLLLLTNCIRLSILCTACPYLHWCLFLTFGGTSSQNWILPCRLNAKDASKWCKCIFLCVWSYLDILKTTELYFKRHILGQPKPRLTWVMRRGLRSDEADNIKESKWRLNLCHWVSGASILLWWDCICTWIDACFPTVLLNVTKFTEQV